MRPIPNTLRCLAVPLWIMLATQAVRATEMGGGAGLSETLVQSTMRIRYEREEHGATITGHGTAFAVDLAAYGYAGKRYLLSAAHNILDERKQPYGNLKVEMDDGRRTYWSRARALAWDEDLDLCLVEASDDAPRLLTLADRDPGIGSPVIMAGSPRGVPVKLFEGTLTRRFERGTIRSSARIPFDHGDSGGPMVDPRTGKVVGVAVAGIPKDGDMDHDLGLFVPVAGISGFLETHARGTPLRVPASTAVAAGVAPEPAPAALKANDVAGVRARVSPVIPEESPAPAAAVLAVGRRLPAAVTEDAPSPVAHVPVERAPVAPAAAAPVAVNRPPQILATPGPAVVDMQGPPVPASRPSVEGRPSSLPVAASQERKVAVVTPAPTQEAPVKAAPDAGSSPRRYYVVQKGDNLTKIARLYGVGLQTLAEANKLNDPNLVMVGAKLKIPEVAQP
jgi:LysM repeat protein